VHDARLNIDGAVRSVQYVRLVRGDRRRAVFYWYRLNGGIVSGDLSAKLETIGVRLLQGPPGAAIVAVAADYEGDVANARQRVQMLLSAMPGTAAMTGLR
jgi:EpsI family protein